MSERNLAKNTVYYTLGLATQKALSFVYFIFVARMLGVENQGKYSFALTFTTVFAILLDFGITNILIREAARNKEDSQKYLANAVTLKLLGSLLIYLVIVVAVNLMGYPEITKNMVYVSGLVMILDSFALSFFGIIRGHQNLRFESISVVINQLIVLGVGLYALYSHWSLVALVAVYLFGSGFNVLFSWLSLKFKYRIKVKISFDKKIVLNIIKWSLPFAVAGIFSRIYSAMDIILLSKMSGDRSVGIYSVAYKVAFALQFVALAFSASIYPAFCNYFAHSKKKLSQLFVKSMYWLIVLALPLSLGLIAIADKVVVPVFGAQYLESILPLQILMASLLFIFICFPIGALLNASNRQTRNTINLGIVAAVNTVLNACLIPLWDYNGAAIANLLSYVLLFTLGISLVGRIVDYDKKFLLWSLLKILIAGIIMALVVILLKGYLNFIAVIIIGMAVYGLLAYLLKIVSPQSIKEFTKDFFNKKSLPAEDV